MGGRCDQESDSQTDGAAERRMNDFVIRENKRKKKNRSRMEDMNQRWRKGMKERVRISSQH